MQFLAGTNLGSWTKLIISKLRVLGKTGANSPTSCPVVFCGNGTQAVKLQMSYSAVHVFYTTLYLDSEATRGRGYTGHTAHSQKYLQYSHNFQVVLFSLQ